MPPSRQEVARKVNHSPPTQAGNAPRSACGEGPTSLYYLYSKYQTGVQNSGIPAGSFSRYWRGANPSFAQRHPFLPRHRHRRLNIGKIIKCQAHFPSLHLYAHLAGTIHIFFGSQALGGFVHRFCAHTLPVGAQERAALRKRRIPFDITSSNNMNSSHMLL